MSNLICPKCETTLASFSNFCPNCGASLQITAVDRAKITPFKFLLLVVTSIGLFLFGWMTQATISGKKPEKMFSAAAAVNPNNSGNSSNPHEPANEPDYNDPEIENLRKQAKDKPLDLELQKQFSMVLIKKIRSFEVPPQGLVFETIDTLRNVLNLNANDPQALIAMADISFDQQAFSKAIDFYKRYIEIEKTDLNARARYASSLTFVGKYDEALSELSGIIKKDPKNFHARAYTAITYAQMGKIPEARKFGQEALDLAPSPEAKERFSQFLKQLDAQTTKSSSPERGNLEPKAVTEGELQTSHHSTEQEEKTNLEKAGIEEVSPVVSYIKGNSVAAPKFVSYTYTEQGELVLNFKDFPMEAMPPFVRDKFLNSLKEASKTDPKKPSKILIKELSEPARVLETLSLN